MGRNGLKAADGEGMLRAMTDGWRDVELEYSIVIKLDISPTNRRGVLQLSLTAHKTPVDLFPVHFARYAVEYPSASVMTLEGALFQAVVKLERIVRDKILHPAGRT